MRIGSHTIGAYPALIQVTYSDGSVSYDSVYGFESQEDFTESYSAIRSVMGSGSPMYDGRTITGASPVIGLDAVRAALGSFYEGASGKD